MTNGRLAGVRRYKDGYRGHYLDDGRYRGGPTFSSQEEANAWVARKCEELERRQISPVGPKWLDPLNARAVQTLKAIPLGESDEPTGNAPEPPIIRRFSDRSTAPVELPDPALLETGDDATSQAPAGSKESLLMLDSFVHDFVGSLHGDATGRPDGASETNNAERFLHLLNSTSSSKGQVLGSPVFFGASPDIGLESALSLLGSLRMTGVLRIQAGDVLFTVSIVNGDVVHGVSYPRPESELLGNLLVALGAIDAERLDRFFAEHGSSASSIGEALNQQALVSMSELQEALLYQLQLLFDRLLATRESVWCFHAGEATLAYINMRLNVMGVILESARKSDEEMAA